MAKPFDARRTSRWPRGARRVSSKTSAELDPSLDWRVAWPTRHRPGSSLMN